MTVLSHINFFQKIGGIVAMGKFGQVGSIKKLVFMGIGVKKLVYMLPFLLYFMIFFKISGVYDFLGEGGGYVENS